MGNKNMRFGQYAKYIRLIDSLHKGDDIASVEYPDRWTTIVHYRHVTWARSYRRAKQILMPWMAWDDEY